MKNETTIIGSSGAAGDSFLISKPLQLASAFLLGMVLLYGAVLVQTSIVHNAAHDVRHSQGFPCH
mgnify:CR=1 FL=1|jgi:cobalt transporter subunit CbtB